MITELSLRTVAADGYHVIEAYGEIDVANAGELQGMVDSCVAGGADRLIVDLSGIRFMDSSGLNVLIGMTGKVGCGSYAVVVSRPSIRRVFALTGIDKIVPIFASVTEAIENFKGDTGPDDSFPPGPESILEPN